MEIIYGCDCVCSNHSNGAENAPCAFLVERNGKQMKVCTRCDLTSDQNKVRLFDTETIFKPFFEFDPLGALCLTNFVQMSEEEYKDYQKSRR